MVDMKIAIVGAGAMGSLYGAMISESDHEVWLLDVWKKHIETVNSDGLIIEKGSGQKKYEKLKATTDPSEIGVVDLAIIFVKSTLTADAVRSNKSIFADNTIVLTLQNGVGNIEKIAENINKNNVIAGTTAHGSTILGPGRIRHAGEGKTIIGELDGSESKRVAEIAEIFNASGLQTDISNNVIGLIWDKLVVNVGINALTAITEMSNGELVKCPEIEEILEVAVREAVSIAELKGIQLGSSDPVKHTKDVAIATAANKSSMLQDILNKRKTEIEMINGAVVTEGKALGVNTPVNLVLTNLVKWKQRRVINLT